MFGPTVRAAIVQIGGFHRHSLGALQLSTVIMYPAAVESRPLRFIKYRW
jgi:hypothetical protein